MTTTQMRLPLPDTVRLHVVQDHYGTHVDIARDFTFAESCGRYLCDVARVIARDHVGRLSTARADGDLFAAMVDAFVAASFEQ
jgi:hypothetical protein